MYQGTVLKWTMHLYDLYDSLHFQIIICKELSPLNTPFCLISISFYTVRLVFLCLSSACRSSYRIRFSPTLSLMPICAFDTVNFPGLMERTRSLFSYLFPTSLRQPFDNTKRPSSDCICLEPLPRLPPFTLSCVSHGCSYASKIIHS